MSSYNCEFSIETAACPAIAETSSTSRCVYGITSASKSSGVSSFTSPCRLRLINCTTPITWSLWSFIGMVSIDLER